MSVVCNHTKFVQINCL